MVRAISAHSAHSNILLHHGVIRALIIHTRRQQTTHAGPDVIYLIKKKRLLTHARSLYLK